MLFFGLFSTPVPYIVLAAVYSLYLISFSVDKLTAGKELSNPGCIELKIITENSNSIEKAFNYYNIQFVDFYLPSQPGSKMPAVPDLNIPRLISEKKVISHCFYFPLFPNPPPSTRQNFS